MAGREKQAEVRSVMDLLDEIESETSLVLQLIQAAFRRESFASEPLSHNFRYTVRYMVTKQASPPTRLEIGSAKKTPITPRAGMFGSRTVSGTTMMILRKSEKKTACFDFPRETKADCPANWNDIMKKPMK